MADPCERTRKRQRISTPSTEPARIQPTQRSKQDGPVAQPIPKTKIVVLKVSAQRKARKPEQEQEPQLAERRESAAPSSKYRITLHHSVYSHWKPLPFASPQQIKLKIAINAHETGNDIVHYAPESAAQTHLVPWKRGTDVCLFLPHAAVIVTMTDALKNEKKHLMLFEEDMEDALKHKERYEAVEILQPNIYPDWYPSLVRLWGEAPQGKITIQNVFDKTQQEFLIQNTLDLEAHRMRNVMESIKLDFKKKSGLSFTEVQDIFMKRTEIAVVLTHCRTGLVRNFGIQLHRRWLKYMGVVAAAVKVMQRPVACALFHGPNHLRLHMELSACSINPAQVYARAYNATAIVVLDVGYHHAGATTVMLTANNGRCSAKRAATPVTINNGQIDLQQPVKDMLEGDHGEVIRAAVAQSDKSYDDVLQKLFEDFGIALNWSDGDSDMPLKFREGISATFQDGNTTSTTINALLLTRESIAAIVKKWLEPIIELARQELIGLKDAVARRQLQYVAHRKILMTGYWTWSPCIVRAFKAALQDSCFDGVFVMVDGPGNDNSLFATTGALWSTTTDQNSTWKINEDAPEKAP